MQDVFNTMSLARLSRQELLLLLASLQGRLNAASSDVERHEVSCRINATKQALALK